MTLYYNKIPGYIFPKNPTKTFPNQLFNWPLVLNYVLCNN